MAAVEFLVTQAEYDRLERVARRRRTTVNRLVERALAKSTARKRNDYAGGGLTVAQAKAQRKQLLRDIELEHRRKDLAKLAALRRDVAIARERKKVSRSGVLELCRSTGKDAARLRASAARFAKSAKNRARDAATACAARKAEIQRSAATDVEKAKEALRAEKAYQGEIRRIERRATTRARPRSTAAERQQESDDEVLSNIPPELVTLWRKVRRQIKASDRMSRTESFLRYVEEHPDDATAAIQEDSDREVNRLVREAAAEEERLHRAGYGKSELADLSDVPF